MTKTHIALVVLTALVFSGSQVAYAADPAHADQPIVPAPEAISRLKEGNGRYTSGNQHPHESSEERAYMGTNSYENASMTFLGMSAAQAAKRHAELTKSQHPFAIIVSCSDSRVPPEIVFDQGLGDLFVLRVAGNVINDESLGSIVP
jgi:carbonic anhydrase